MRAATPCPDPALTEACIPVSKQVLKKPWQFRQVYRAGEKIDCKYAVVFYHRVDCAGAGPSIGVVASRRIGGAVQRNRAKRLLREAAARIVPRLADRNIWVVLVARAIILNTKCDDLVAEIEHKLADARLLD